MSESIAKLANTTTTTTTDWVPPAGSDYAAIIVDQAQAAGLLLDSAAAVAHNKQAGTGASVRVRISPKRTAQGPISEGSSLTATETTTDYVDVTIQKFGDYDQLTGESIFQTNGPLVAKVLAAMAKGIARKYDTLIWDELKTLANATTETSLAVTGDLTANDDFAKKLLDCISSMQKLDVEPDHILMGPDQINALRQIKAQNSMIGASISLDEKGMVTGFGGCKVINMKSIANANAVTADMVHAIVFDSSRAYAIAYGQPLKFESDRVIESDLEKHVCWSWFGVNTVDADGVGVVKNPAA